MARRGKGIARSTIEDLFRLADEMYRRGEIELSRRYLKLARKTSLRIRVKIPEELKMRYCKHCFTPQIPGESCRVRIRENGIIYTCLNCGEVRRYPLKKGIKGP